MRSHPKLSAAAVVSSLGLVALVAYLLLPFLVMAVVALVVYRVIRHRLGFTPRVRRGRTVLELAAAFVAAWWGERKLRPELEARARTQAARASELEGRAALAHAKAADAEAVALEARRRADRAKGVTRSEIAQLQSGSLMRGHISA